MTDSPTIADLAALVGSAPESPTDPDSPVGYEWFDRFGDGRCWCLGVVEPSWSIGTDGDAMSELRADCLGFPGPIRDPDAALAAAIEVVRRKLAAGEMVW